MKTRADYLHAIEDAKIETSSEQEGWALIEAFLLTAATIANGMSDQSVGWSQARVVESTNRMLRVLEDTFDV